MTQSTETPFEPGDLVRHKKYGCVGMVLQEVRSNVFPLNSYCPDGFVREHTYSPHDPIRDITYYQVLMKGKKVIYSPCYLELLAKGKNNE
jgi:hypothetical protein